MGAITIWQPAFCSCWASELAGGTGRARGCPACPVQLRPTPSWLVPALPPSTPPGASGDLPLTSSPRKGGGGRLGTTLRRGVGGAHQASESHRLKQGFPTRGAGLAFQAVRKPGFSKYTDISLPLLGVFVRGARTYQKRPRGAGCRKGWEPLSWRESLTNSSSSSSSSSLAPSPTFLRARVRRATFLSGTQRVWREFSANCNFQERWRLGSSHWTDSSLIFGKKKKKKKDGRLLKGPGLPHRHSLFVMGTPEHGGAFGRKR